MTQLFTLDNTEEYFMEAFVNLLLSKPIHKISVRELCQKTGYNRSTFYYYFVDIYDLEEKTHQKMIEKIISQINIRPHLTDEEFVQSLTTIYDNYGPILLLFFRRSDFYVSYKAALKPLAMQAFKPMNLNIKQEELDITYDFIMGGILSLLDSHSNGWTTLPTNQLALFIQKQISRLIEEKTATS